MRVIIAFDVDDETRVALRKREGRNGKATRAEIRAEIDALWESHQQDVCDDADRR